MISAQVRNVDKFAAAAFLESSQGNRPISRTTVDSYAAAMRRGEWLLNGEGIQFDADGNLLNGHHRCHAIIKSGVAIQALVVEGCDKESFKTFDGGKKRGTGDMLAIKGELNAIKLAAVARAYAMLQEPKKPGGDFTPTVVMDCLDKHPELRYWTQKQVGNGVLKRFPSLLSAIAAAASEKYGNDVVEVFFDKLATGIGLQKGDPALLLRERFLNLSDKKMRMQHNMSTGLIVKAINAHIKGKKLGVLRFNPEEAMPVIE
tara:strand:- start:180 stop:959 length:780 start_codon:yes stop_codon:yes gene_type:complete